MDIREEAIKRMQRILDRYSRKLKLAVSLPHLLDNTKFKSIFNRHSPEYKKMYKFCNDANWEYQQQAIEECANSSREGSLQLVVYKSPDSKAELEWTVIIDILFQHEEEILPLIDEIFDEIEPSYVVLLKYIGLLKEIMEWEMRKTPRQLRECKIELRNAAAVVIRIQEEIEQLDEELNEERIKHNEIVEKSKEEINDLKVVIEEIKQKHREELDHEKNCYKNAVRGLREDIAEVENNLNNQLEAHEVLLEKLILVNLQREKTLRDLCIKAEKKNLVARNTYDRDLSKLNELKETLETQLRVTNNHYQLLQNEYDVQSVLHLNLKKERELAMMQAFAEQLDNFEKNRAARIIQRTWRAYHERVSSKKKKRTRRNK